MIQDFLPIKSPLDKPELSSPEKHVVLCTIIIGTCIMSIKIYYFYTELTHTDLRETLIQ